MPVFVVWSSLSSSDIKLHESGFSQYIIHNVLRAGRVVLHVFYDFVLPLIFFQRIKR